MAVRINALLTCTFIATAFGCHYCHDRAQVTAVPLSPWNQGEPCGIPYYLPKPLLIIAKNVRHIDETKVGLTGAVPIPNSFDNQASYADLKANVSNPQPSDGSTTTAKGGQNSAPLADSGTTSPDGQPSSPTLGERMTPQDAPSDGLTPETFYTYQIIFVPDLSQKYGLRIKGGPGEMRAAMDLVNGWMFTGLGPYYLKDSSRAQNIMACGVATMFAGRGVADVANALTNLQRQPGTQQSADLSHLSALRGAVQRVAAEGQQIAPGTLHGFAEIAIYEPKLIEDGSTQWVEIAHHTFDREYLGASQLAQQGAAGLPSAAGPVPPALPGEPVPPAPPEHELNAPPGGPSLGSRGGQQSSLLGPASAAVDERLAQYVEASVLAKDPGPLLAHINGQQSASISATPASQTVINVNPRGTHKSRDPGILHRLLHRDKPTIQFHTLNSAGEPPALSLEPPAQQVSGPKYITPPPNPSLHPGGPTE